MHYCSTRGSVKGWNFEQVLFSGFAPDGGLFMPEKIPELNLTTLQRWSKFNYVELVKEICSVFISSEDIPHSDQSGTSGDTGSAAIESVRGMNGVDIIVIYPKGRCTKVQELQMTTVTENNVHVFEADGTSDDIDVILRKLFADLAFVKEHILMSSNSINWFRILVQMAHFFYGYFQCVPLQELSSLPLLEVVVPTGGAGNITAGCIAVKMGLPLRIVSTVNENDIIFRTIKHGDFSLASSVKHTLAPAIDIQWRADAWKDRKRDYASSRPREGSCPGWYGYHGKRAWKLNHIGACGHCQGALGCPKSPGRQHFRHTQRHLEHGLVKIKGAASLHSLAGVGWKRMKPGGEEWRTCFLATASAAKFQEVLKQADLPLEIPAKIAALETLDANAVKPGLKCSIAIFAPLAVGCIVLLILLIISIAVCNSK
ncbi:THNS2 protein, partial [Polypterus senegalus]